jgi:hypothetical protein
MINSFIDMVNESNLNKDGLVDEMGVKRPERLSGSQMGTIRQETIRRREQMANRPPTRSFTQVAAELEQALKNIPRTQITMEKPSNTRSYYPKFPQEIVALMNELKGIDENRFTSNFGYWRDLYPNNSDSIHFRTEGPSDSQRSHFPNGGIPVGLRGTGLGYKLYRTLLKYAGYISSNTSGTREKDKAWGSMLDYKANPDGSPSEDDCHAIIGPSNWMAIDKTTLPNRDKVDIAQRFITSTIGLNNTKSDRFDIDDELLAIMPDTFLTQLHPSYLDELVNQDRLSSERKEQIVAARTEAQRIERERAEREEVERRERRSREEAETRQRLATRLTQFGADPDAEWNIGDFIVVKQYLYDSSYSGLPIRRVVAQDGRSYVAVKIADAIRIDAGEISPNQSNDARTTSDKTSWIKINLESIPDLDAVNLTSLEKRYVQSLLDPEELERRREAEREAERQRVERERQENTERAASKDTFGILPTNGRDLKQLTINRPSLQSIDLLKKARTGDFVKFILLAPSQRDQLRGYAGIPVFAAFERMGRATRSVENPEELISNPRNIVLINLVTGKAIQPPFTGLGLTAYRIEPVTEEDKLRARGGDHYYIANHMNNWGILAKCDYTTRNTANQPFIYMNTFGGGERPTAVRLDLLRKLVGDPIEL